MLKMKQGMIPSNAQAYLDRKQAEIDEKDTYRERVDIGKKLWKSKSSTQFKNIRVSLNELCVGKRRCNYCEDSVADEVEHIKPKDLYPNNVFIWENYLFACGNCNGPKSNKFAIFLDGDVVEISRKRGAPVFPPEEGDEVFINPRADDPLDFFILDLKTLLFQPRASLSVQDKKRAEYTREVLALNSRDFLVAARREALEGYLDSLKLYVNEKANGASQVNLARKQKSIESRQHPTVWEEMKRQRHLHPTLLSLFSQAPELL